MHFRPFQIILYVCFLLSIALANASEQRINLYLTDQIIQLDGFEDPAWQQADSATKFVQLQPYFGQPSSQQTVAKILTTERALYCLIKCYEKREFIQQTKGTLDDHSGDVVSIMLDTFDDNRTAYRFAVSAAGVRSDARMLDDGRQTDYSWDGVWFSAAHVFDWGFVVEIEIPYRSIQYKQDLPSWGIDFDRWMAKRTEDTYWSHYEESEGLRVSKFGRMSFVDFYPTIKGLNLEIYPVGIAKSNYLNPGSYDTNTEAGLDVFYNPSQQLTFQMTANPDFAQIEADPFDFNITRYESYFEERRPFFIEGKEVFTPSGRENRSGFYRPLELFYSRRIGKILPDGSTVPLNLGAKAFGRIGDWEYGGFLARTGEKSYDLDGQPALEERAMFHSVRLKKQILSNSQIGLLYVGKQDRDTNTGVVDIDGAFRRPAWQLSYQIARSYKNDSGDFAGSLGFLSFTENMFLGLRSRHVGEDFDINEVGYVPWKGTTELTTIGGPRWYYEDGYLRALLIYTGFSLYHEKVDRYTDRSAVLGLNMQFRNNWGYEINFVPGRAKDQDALYNSFELSLSSWFNMSPRWNSNLSAGLSHTYNFNRDYLGYYSWLQTEFSWQALDILELGTSLNAFVEGDPEKNIEDITYNARPFFSWTPINNLNMRLYVDNVLLRSTGQVEQVLSGFLFSYNFRPKSWIYFAINELRDRPEGLQSLHIADRVSVVKVKYLFYF